MALSEEQRRALHERAIGLRAEVSALSTERDLAVDNAAQDKADAKLLAEVARLERERDAAIVARDNARTVGLDEATALMERAIQEQAERGAQPTVQPTDTSTEPKPMDFDSPEPAANVEDDEAVQ